MFLLSSIFRGLEFWSVNHTSMYESFKWKVFKNIKFLGGISNNQRNGVIWINMHKTLTNNHCEQYYKGLILHQWFGNDKYFHNFYL